MNAARQCSRAVHSMLCVRTTATYIKYCRHYTIENENLACSNVMKRLPCRSMKTEDREGRGVERYDADVLPYQFSLTRAQDAESVNTIEVNPAEIALKMPTLTNESSIYSEARQIFNTGGLVGWNRQMLRVDGFDVPFSELDPHLYAYAGRKHQI